MTSWQLSYVSGTWYDIPNPTNQLNVVYQTTQNKVKLYTGDHARTIPTTKYSVGDVDLEFSFIPEDSILIKDVTGTSKSLATLLKENTLIKIRTHRKESTKWYEISGYLTEVDEPWLLGLYPRKSSTAPYDTEYVQYFDLKCKMDVVSEGFA
jgi:hypothetical protein